MGISAGSKVSPERADSRRKMLADPFGKSQLEILMLSLEEVPHNTAGIPLPCKASNAFFHRDEVTAIQPQQKSAGGMESNSLKSTRIPPPFGRQALFRNNRNPVPAESVDDETLPYWERTFESRSIIRL